LKRERRERGAGRRGDVTSAAMIALVAAVALVQYEAVVLILIGVPVLVLPKENEVGGCL